MCARVFVFSLTCRFVAAIKCYRALDSEADSRCDLRVLQRGAQRYDLLRDERARSSTVQNLRTVPLRGEF